MIVPIGTNNFCINFDYTNIKIILNVIDRFSFHICHILQSDHRKSFRVCTENTSQLSSSPEISFNCCLVKYAKKHWLKFIRFGEKTKFISIGFHD